MIAVYETWGSLFFEAYDPTVVCTMTLQVMIRCFEVQSRYGIARR